MAITAEQRQQVARWLRDGVPAGARGQLEVLRRWHDPAPADRQAIDQALGYGMGIVPTAPVPLAAGVGGNAEAARRFTPAGSTPSVEHSATYWEQVRHAAAEREKRAYMEQNWPGSTAGLPEIPDPAA